VLQTLRKTSLMMASITFPKCENILNTFSHDIKNYTYTTNIATLFFPTLVHEGVKECGYFFPISACLCALSHFYTYGPSHVVL